MEENKIIRDDLLQSVSDLTDEQLNMRVEEGRWTIMQVLHHLYLMEQAITKSIVNQLENGQQANVPDKPIELAVNRSTKVTAPSFVVPSETFITLEKMKTMLSASRQSFMNVVNTADVSLLNSRAFQHPVFGDLSLKQWIPFIGIHEKRHLAQIEELKEKLT